MNIKSLIILVACLIIGASAYYFSTANKSINSVEKIGTAFIPGLLAKLNDVATIEITKANDQVLATLLKNEDSWVVKEKKQFPADITKIRASLLAIAEAKILEQKTSNPDLYAKLGVEDVANKDAQGIKAVIQYGDNKGEIIVGNPGPQINKTRYVRHANNTTSWLIDRKIDLNYDSAHWLRKDILSVEPDEMREVVIELADGSKLEIKNTNLEENKFEVTNLSDPESQVVDAEIHQVTNALSSFQLLDIAADNSIFVEGQKKLEASYRLKSGIVIDIDAYEVDQEHFVALNIYGEKIDDQAIDESVKKKIEQLQAKTTGWIYKIPNVTYDSMNKSESDVLAITEDQLN